MQNVPKSGSIEYAHSLSWQPGGDPVLRGLRELRPGGGEPHNIPSHFIVHHRYRLQVLTSLSLSARYPPSYPFEVDIPPVRDVIEGLSPLIALIAFGNGILFCSGTTFNYIRDHFWTSRTRGIVE